MTSDVAANLVRAKEWATLDPNPRTSRYVRGLIERVERGGDDDDADAAAARRRLRALFPVAPDAAGPENRRPGEERRRPQPRIAFGTAGLRGRMEPGSAGHERSDDDPNRAGPCEIRPSVRGRERRRRRRSS